MPFISKLLSFVAPSVLDWVVRKLSSLISEWIKRESQKEKIEKINRGIREKVEEAKTKEERERATENSASHF